jgi:glycosyltransferase involved in cell wall biosynthesis
LPVIFENKVLREIPQDRRRFPAAVSIAFYNNIRMLDLTLASFEAQSFKDFEIIICDDGSKPEAVDFLKSRIENMTIPVKHLWHEDLGFRKNRIMNWGIHFADSDYLIFIDQDCLAHPQFVREHIDHRKDKSVLCGRRMDLIPWISKILTPEKIRQGFIQRNLWWILPAGLYMKDNNGGKGLYFKSPFLRRLANQKPRGIVGCNFSVHRQDLLAINGFDNRYEGPGTGEDSDIEYRLGLQGVRMQPFVNTAVQYHVYHKLLNRPSENEKIFSQVQRQGNAVTAYGISQQLAESKSAH